MMIHILFLLIGLICAGAGGELFIRGAVGLSSWARIPARIIGATIAAFATSSPELSVAISSSMAGNPTVALGDAIGSNIVNIGAILGLAAIFSSIAVSREEIRRDFPVALAAPFAVGLLTLDGRLSRLDGLILLGLFVAWLIATIQEARQARAVAQATRDTAEVIKVNPVHALLFSAAGLILLVLAGRTIVYGAVGLATAAGMDTFVIGATVVALGTSVPELATTILAKARGHQEVAIGTVLGSNIFNSLFIVGVAATISPMTVPFLSVVAGLMTGAVLTACVYPPTSGVLDRRRGAILLAFYIVFVAVQLQIRPGEVDLGH